jgi:hypothetical protein
MIAEHPIAQYQHSHLPANKVSIYIALDHPIYRVLDSFCVCNVKFPPQNAVRLGHVEKQFACGIRKCLTRLTRGFYDQSYTKVSSLGESLWV